MRLVGSGCNTTVAASADLTIQGGFPGALRQREHAAIGPRLPSAMRKVKMSIASRAASMPMISRSRVSALVPVRPTDRRGGTRACPSDTGKP